jgi:serine/threonine-protein kinase
MQLARKSTSRLILFTTAFLSITALVLGLTANKAQSIDLPNVIPNVPKVVGMTPQKAKKKLKKRCKSIPRGISVDTVGVEEPSRHGIVISQKPKAGKNCNPAAGYHLRVGKLLVKVPYLKGKSMADAKNVLGQIGLIGKDNGTKPSHCRYHLRVSDQRPWSGVKKFKGGTVDLWKGTCRVRVPNIVGLQPNEARSKLDNAYLKYSSREGVLIVTNSERDGKVVRQTPKAGEWVAGFSHVRAWIGNFKLRKPAEMERVPRGSGVKRIFKPRAR